MTILATAATAPSALPMMVVLIAIALMIYGGKGKNALTIRDNGAKRCASCRKHRRDCTCHRPL